jgi:hypothetical protein
MRITNIAPAGGERISRLSITLHHAAFAGVQKIPPGWIVGVTNEANWRTSLEAHAIVGAAFLDDAALLNDIEIRPETGYNCHAAAQMIQASAIIYYYKNDKFFNKNIPPRSILISD